MYIICDQKKCLLSVSYFFLIIYTEVRFIFGNIPTNDKTPMKISHNDTKSSRSSTCMLIFIGEALKNKNKNRPPPT